MNSKIHTSALRSQPQALLDAIPDLLFEVDAQGRIHDYHSPRSDLLAAPPEVFLGRLISEILPAEACNICMNALQEAARDGWHSGATYSLDLPQGKRWFELSVSAFTSATTEPAQRFIFLARDITKRMQDEESLRIAAKTFESQQGIFVTDAKGAILRTNRAFSTITGYSAADVVGKNPRVLSSGRHSAHFYQLMWSSVARNNFWQGEIWNRRKSGEEYPQWLTINAVTDESGMVTHYVAVFSDSTSIKSAEAQIESLAYADPLTNLPNRRHLILRLQQLLSTAGQGQQRCALLLIDLDAFRTLNDALGHDVGDTLLLQVARQLRQSVRDDDTVARIGADEFVVLLTRLNANPEEALRQAESVAQKLLTDLNRPYHLSGSDHFSSCSIGITLIDGAQQDDVEVVLRQADLAIYQAKSAGRSTVRFFDPRMQDEISARVALEARLRRAVEVQQFYLLYQPQVDHLQQVTGAEALIRWRDDARDAISPAEFIPLAEATGLIRPIGQWVLETACQQLVQWAALAGTRHLTLAVNVSAVQFHQTDFVEQVLGVVQRTGANPQRLKLELTESLLVNNIDTVIVKMNALKEHGIGFSLDDFGTGYSSLAYLKRLPLGQLKIDQGFVRDILVDANDEAIARTVIALAHSMGLGVIAEGVETQAHRDALVTMGCLHFQGYHFARPLPAQAFLDFVLASRPGSEAASGNTP